MTDINLRRGTAAQWTSADPVLPEGQTGWESDTLKAKLGDGITSWNDLPYATHPPHDAEVTSVNGETGDVVLDRTDIGLGNVNNTSDALKPISTATAAALADKADIDSPSLTGVPTAPTASTSNNTTQIATTAYVKSNLAAKADLDSPALTGNPTAPTPAVTDDDTSIATTAFVKDAIGAGQPLKFGVISVTLTAEDSHIEALTFPAPFTGIGAPTVVATLASGSANYIAGVGAVTNVGCNIVVFQKDGVDVTVTVNVMWIAAKA